MADKSPTDRLRLAAIKVVEIFDQANRERYDEFRWHKFSESNAIEELREELSKWPTT